MAKKIRFPLEMENDVQVRTLEELQNHFSLEKVLVYISNGKMITWLEDRYLKDMAQKVKELDSEDGEYNKKICEIFDVEYVPINLDVDEVIERNRKIKLLKDAGFEDYIEVVDMVAFEQDDIYDLLDIEAKTIYLCDSRFEIPIDEHGVKYIGIGKSIATISSKEKIDFDEREIKFESIIFDEKYQAILEECEQQEIKALNAFGEYAESTFTKQFMQNSDIEKARKMYSLISKELEGINYDVDDDTRDIIEYLVNTGLENWGIEYMEKI